MRNEASPPWLAELCLNARTWVRETLAFLARTGESAFYPTGEAFEVRRQPRDFETLGLRLQYAIAMGDHAYATALREHLLR